MMSALIRTNRKPVRYLCVLVLTIAQVGVPVAAQTRVKLGTLAPEGTSYCNLLKGMGQKWRHQGVQLTAYCGTMGSEADIVSRMRVGQLQAATLTVGGLAKIDPAVTALQVMPMMFRSLEEVDYVRERLQPMLSQRLEERGFVALFWGDAGWVRFFSRRPAQTPEDFKRMKVFVTAGDNNQVDIMKAAGYNPVPLEWTDALTSLQTGLIDAVPTAPFLALAGQYYTTAKHMLEVNWVPLVGATVITKGTWDALPPKTREALLKVAAETGDQFRAQGRALSNNAVEAMKKRGLQVTPVSPQVAARWRELAEQFYPQIRGRMVPSDMFDETRRLLAEYRATRSSSK
jgi:TRAP-type C4-dicarboxylate transport system substrate-binding protein